MRLVMLGLAVVLCVASSKEERAALEGMGAEDTQAKTPDGPPVKLTAKALMRAYRDNEVGADVTFKGKKLEVEGFVESINKDMLDGANVVLKAGSGDTVHCQLRSGSESGAADLNRGQDITVTGVGKGMFLGSPIIGDCWVSAK